MTASSSSSSYASACEKYLKQLYNHLCQNKCEMDLNQVTRKFGTISKLLPREKGKSYKLIRVLESDLKKRFVINLIKNGRRKGQHIVRANPKTNDDTSREQQQDKEKILRTRKIFQLADNNTDCYYIDNPSELRTIADFIKNIKSPTQSENEGSTSSRNDALSVPKIVSIGCCFGTATTTPNSNDQLSSLELFQIATNQEPACVYLLDCQRIDNNTLRSFLKSLLTEPSIINLVHDMYREEALARFLYDLFDDVDNDKNDKAISALQRSSSRLRLLDTQLLGELIWGSHCMDRNEFLSKLDVPIKDKGHEFLEHQFRTPGFEPWSRRPIPKNYLECAASKVAWLQKAATTIQNLPRVQVQRRLEQLLLATTLRLQQSVAKPSFRTLCFDTRNNFLPSSTELMMAAREKDGFYGEPLAIEGDIEEVLSILPPVYTTKLWRPSSNTMPESKMATAVPPHRKERHPIAFNDQNDLNISKLSDLVLDFGRRAHCWINQKRIFLCDDPSKVVEENELENILSHLGSLGSDNRAGLERSLHRFSVLKDRTNKDILGITIRIGRHVRGNASMLMDLLFNEHKEKSILILGEPGSGKTTIVREAARILAQKDSNVFVMDTSNEIAGDGKVPHSCIGQARRMMVPSLDQQGSKMIECVQNHTPHVMVIDEIGRSSEVKAASTSKQRGVRMLASAHGDLRKLVKNGELNGLVGGLESVTIGDEMAKEQAKKKQKEISKTITQRKGAPIFDIIVEVSRESQHEWKIIHDTAFAVDKILDGLQYPYELRSRDPETGTMWTKRGNA